MNRKQAVIIVALLILIVCAGVLATRVQSPLYVSDTDLVDSSNNTNSSTPSNSTNKTSGKQDYFAEAKLTRDKTSEETVANLKEIIDDKNATAQNKESAQQESISIALEQQNEMKVENMLKGKGYKDALCTINSDKVNVVVKGNSAKLSDEQQRQIRDVVLNVTKIRNIEIQPPTQ